MKRHTQFLQLFSFIVCIVLSSCSLHRTAMKGHSINETKKFALANQLPANTPNTEINKTQAPATIANVHESPTLNRPQENKEGQLSRNTVKESNLKIKVDSKAREKGQMGSSNEKNTSGSLFPLKKISMAHSYDSSGRPWILTIVICFFLGILGIHRFYLGYNGIGLIQFALFLFALFFVSVKSTIWDVTFKLTLYHIPVVSAIAFIILFVWVLTDFIRIIMKKLKPKVGHYTS